MATVSGKYIIFPKVAFPAANSAASSAIPEAIAVSRALSNQEPITGCQIEVDNIPAPPTSDIPKAPVLGVYSEVKPIMVGQKKQTPNANNTAAA